MEQFFNDNVWLTNHNRNKSYPTRHTGNSTSSSAAIRHILNGKPTCKYASPTVVCKSDRFGMSAAGAVGPTDLSGISDVICNFRSVRPVSSTTNRPIGACHRMNLSFIFILFLLVSSSGVVIPVLTIDASFICNRIPGLVPRQRIICRSHPDAMAAVGEGGTLALEECRHQFRSNRWNCYGPDEGASDDDRSSQPLLNVAPFGK